MLAHSACTDSGVVGAVHDCDPPCAGGERCDPDAGVCVACEGRACLVCPDGSACERADECDDCPVSDTACVALFCRSCQTSDDCLADEPLCIRGRCVDL